MEADEVFSQLSDKISGTQDKLSEFQGTIDFLQSSIRDQKSASDKTQSDIDRINSALNDLKSGAGTKQDNSQQDQALADLRKKIDDAVAADLKQQMDMQGTLSKLSAKLDDAAAAILKFPDVVGIVGKAVDDGKKEILNSVSNITTGLIKDAEKSIKESIESGLKSLVSDDVKDVQSAQPAPLTDEELTAKIKSIVEQTSEKK